MKKYQYIIFILSFIFNCLSYGQNTWSKEYDLGEGRNNYLRDIIAVDENEMIYLSSWQFCPTEEPNVYLECCILSNYSLDGNFINEVIIDSTTGVDYGNIFFLEGEFNHITALNYETLGKFYQLTKTDNDLNQLSKNIIDFGDDFYSSVSGIKIILDKMYIFGTVFSFDFSEVCAFFAKLDDSLNVEFINKYPARQLNVEMNDIQATPDGNLAFILKQRGPANPSGWAGYEIYKVNHNGEVLDSFVFKEGFGSNWPYNLTLDESGNYYFYSDKHPIDGFPASIGRMNKLNKDMKALEWSTILPNSKYGRIYKIEEQLLAKNGDIIICGSVYDTSEDFEGPNTTYNGFITRLDQKGNIIWHHIYKVPNDEYFPQSEYGLYRQSQLNKIVEMEDGSLLAGGNHFYHYTVYDHPDFDDTKETNLLWLLKVDADGCIEGEECGEVIVLDQQFIPEAPIFTFGTKWTYDFESNDLGPFVKSYINYEITDTFWRNDSLIYLVTNNRNLPNIEMVQDHKKIYLLDPMTKRWQLTYDFYAYNSYRTEYFDPFSNKIDSTTLTLNTGPFILVDMRERGLVRRQEVTALENGTSSEPLRYDIAEGVGKLSGGLSLELGLGLSNLPYTIGKIRCFEQGDFAINFTDALPSDEYLACDSVRYTSSVKDENYSTVTISPNPFSEQLNITLEGRDSMIGRLVNSSGQVVRRIEIKKSRVLDGLEHLASGFYAFVLSDQQGNVLQIEKMIKE